MARTAGSNDLYHLIHSLSAEEKGYFVKFAKRQVNEGNRHLQLFQLINQQHTFDEKQLKKKFKRYTAMKLYLKEIITESLLLYYRHQHPHINLFNQIQKIHVMIVKGMNTEALKLVNKALRLSTKMELFSQTRYLLRLSFDLSKHRFSSTEEHQKGVEFFKAKTVAAMTADENLMKMEFLNEKWYLSFSDYDFDPGHSFVETEKITIQSLPSLSLRAEGKKASALNWLLMLDDDMESVYRASKQVATLEKKLKNFHDSAVNTVPVPVSLL